MNVGQTVEWTERIKILNHSIPWVFRGVIKKVQTDSCYVVSSAGGKWISKNKLKERK